MSINGAATLFINQDGKGILAKIPADILQCIFYQMEIEDLLNPIFLGKALAASRMLQKKNAQFGNILEENIYQKLLDGCFPGWRSTAGSASLKNIFIEEFLALTRRFWMVSKFAVVATLTGNLKIINEDSQLSGDVKNALYTLAASNGHYQALDHLSPQDSRDSAIQKAYYNAAYTGQLQVVEYFAREETQAITDETIYMAFIGAAGANQIAIMQYFIEKYPNIINDRCKQSGFFIAADKGHLDVMVYLLSTQRPSLKPSTLANSLHGAALQNHLKIVEWLLKNHDDLVISDSGIREALVSAAGRGSDAVVRYLLEKERHRIPLDHQIMAFQTAIDGYKDEWDSSRIGAANKYIKVIHHLLQYAPIPFIYKAIALLRSIWGLQTSLSNTLLYHFSIRQVKNLYQYAKRQASRVLSFIHDGFELSLMYVAAWLKPVAAAGYLAEVAPDSNIKAAISTSVSANQNPLVFSDSQENISLKRKSSDVEDEEILGSGKRVKRK